MPHFRSGDEARLHQGVQGAQKSFLGRRPFPRLPVFGFPAGMLPGQDVGARREFLGSCRQFSRAKQRGDVRLVRPGKRMMAADIGAEHSTPGRGGLPVGLKRGPQVDCRAGRSQPRGGVGGKAIAHFPAGGQQQGAFQQQTGQGGSDENIGGGVIAGCGQRTQLARTFLTQNPQKMLVQKVVQGCCLQPFQGRLQT